MKLIILLCNRCYDIVTNYKIYFNTYFRPYSCVKRSNNKDLISSFFCARAPGSAVTAKIALCDFNAAIVLKNDQRLNLKDDELIP